MINIFFATRSRFALVLTIVVMAFFSCLENKKGESVSNLFLDDDLEATLWAESPMFYNPTNMDVDSRGRIWITEAVNYRNYNNDSLKHIHHSAGDRVMILVDTDDDGKADDAKVFVQDRDLVSPLGIAVIGNKVYVSCSPRLIVYTDENGDDKPDKKEIFLQGFGGLDHDHSLHAIVGGPDGNFYFPTGNAGPHVVTDKSGWTLRSGSMYTGGSPYNTKNSGNMKSDDGKVWVGGLALRIAVDGTKLKVVGHNFRNAYELAVDSRGDLWQNDNDDQVVACRTTWLMEGGNAGYFSTDGTRYWQADQRPGQDMFTAHWHQDDPGVIPAGDNSGAGAPTGIVMYEGDQLGEKYRGMLLSADAGRNVVFAYNPKRSKSGYDLGKRINFITSLKDDNVDYVWNDSLENLDVQKWFRPSDVAIGTEGAIYVADWYDPVVGGHQMDDSTGHGRIYRVSLKNKRLERPKIDMSSRSGQLEAFLNPAVNVRFEASQKLLKNGASIIGDLKKLLNSDNPYHRARAVWLLAQLGSAGKSEVEKLLVHNDEEIRMVAYRALRQYPQEILKYAAMLVDDTSPFVRREVIISLSDMPYDSKKKVLLKLLKGLDAQDRWYLEALGTAVSGHEEEFMAEAAPLLNPDDRPADLWSAEMEALVWRLHPPSYVDELKVRAQSSKLSATERSMALTALAFINERTAVSAMLDLSKSKHTDVADQAKYWVAFRQSNDWFSLANWSKIGIDPAQERNIAAMKVKMSTMLDKTMPWDERRRNARQMARDATGGKMILSLVANKEFPEDLYPEVDEIILQSPDPTVRVQALQYFSAESDRGYDIASISELRSNIENGGLIFVNKCSTCHRVSKKGMDIGPELTLIGKKFDKKSIIDAIVDPSAGIVFGYEAWTITTADGQSHFGFLVGDGKEAVVIKDMSGKSRTIPVSDIVSRKKSERSLMPDASALNLTDQELSDIAGYLTTLR
jgi:putative membrane-bound dehydrogenase-like protein